MDLSKKIARALTILFLVVILVHFGNASSALSTGIDVTFDDWTTFRHDLDHTGRTSGSGQANSAELGWAYLTRQAVWSSPAVVNGCVFVGCKDFNVYCLNAYTGELKWYFWTEGEVNSSPALANGCVYIGSDDGHIYCLNATAVTWNMTGELVWRTKIGGAVRSSPAVLGEHVYVGSGLKDFFCLNAADGSTVWRYPTRFPVNSAPAISEGVVYFACNDFSTYALNASTGQELWQRHTGSNLNSPTIYDGRLYIGGYTGVVYCLNAATGNEIWKFRAENSFVSSPAVADGRVYIGGEDNNVYCLNASSGERIWQTATGYWVCSSPTVSDGNVFVGSEDYNIYCLNASTGAKKWSYPTGSYVDSSPSVVNGVLYVGSHDYQVYALALNDELTDQADIASASAIPWVTILFDAISCFVAGLSVYTILSYFHTKRREQKREVHSQNQPWFRVHTDAVVVLAILVCSSLFFVNLGSGFLWASDEQTYSSMAYHMIRNEDFLTPWGFGDYAIWTGKPPLVIWLMSLSFQAFGVNNFGARAPSAVFGIFSLVLVYYLGKKLYDARVGILSTVVLGTFVTFYEFATHAMLDMPFVFFVMASVYFSVLSEEKENVNLYTLLSGLFFACALFTKLIEALLVPLIAVAFLLVTKRNLRVLFSKRMAVFLGVPILVLVPWMIYMDQRFHGIFWECYFVYTGFMRTVAPLEGHAGNFLFYFNYLITTENLLWVFLLPFATGLSVFNAVVRRIKADALVLTWMVVVLAVFTLAQTKLYWYLLPAMPAFALAISRFIVQLADSIRNLVRKPLPS
jgi:outer membrane protein assembly factor BamB